MGKITHRSTTILQSAIPAIRGPAKHTETNNDVATTVLDRRTGLVKEIITPPDAFRRVHEVMHARHTACEDYPNITHDIVRDIIEDCRLHTHHWPWREERTPESIIASAVARIFEDEQANKGLKGKEKSFARFCMHIRARAVANGLRYDGCRIDVPEIPRTQKHLASQLLQLVARHEHEAAAMLLEEAFFADEIDRPPDDEKEKEPAMEFLRPINSDKPLKPVSEKKKKALDVAFKKLEETDGIRRITAEDMETIFLDYTEPTSHLTVGFRVATSGPRIYRPALRRPVLPQRIFWKRAPVQAGGAILFDASGSMGVTRDVLEDCCLRAPMATVAYYKGDGMRKGWLVIYANGGMRAAKLPANKWPDGNTVDGPALDWLMNQEGPRIFVTDRRFCDSADSDLQAARLSHLEAGGEVTVIESYEEFRDKFPKATSLH